MIQTSVKYSGWVNQILFSKFTLQQFYDMPAWLSTLQSTKTKQFNVTHVKWEVH